MLYLFLLALVVVLVLSYLVYYLTEALRDLARLMKSSSVENYKHAFVDKPLPVEKEEELVPFSSVSPEELLRARFSGMHNDEVVENQL